MRGLFSFASVLLCLAFSSGANAQSVTILHNLVTADGAFPIGPLTKGANGNFYGVTVHGGTFADGTAFEVTSAGVVTVLHNFGTDATDGNGPTAGLLLATDGNFYGTTPFGGASSVGTVFRMTPQGIVTILHQFGVGSDGASPFGSLIEGSDGNFYGLTDEGGTANLGAAYRITPQGVITILHNFGDGTVTNDGTGPSAALIQATDGNFYGTTLSGGANSDGVVFKMTPQGGVTILHSSGDSGTPNDGIGPKANLIQAADGNFYSTTSQGGAGNSGTVFKITPQGLITIMHSFLDGSVANDGTDPEASLLLGKDGNFYGVTNSGGGSPEEGCDFQMTPQGVVTILHSFGDGSVIPDGGTPDGSLVQGADGNFYGLTQNGGSGNNGVVYQLKTTVPQLTGDTNVTGTVGLPFLYQITGTNFPNIFTSTTLPDGLSLSATGVISGTPTTVGTTSVTLTLTNGSGSSTYSLTISIGALPTPAVTSILTAYGSVGTAFTYKTVANNLATSYAATGLTGTGLSLDPTTGIITGTPTTVGTITANLTATNSTGTGAASNLVIQIFATPPTPSQEYNLMHVFAAALPDAVYPVALIQAFDGDFYGVSLASATALASGGHGGGIVKNTATPTENMGAGTLFKITQQGTLTTLTSITNPGSLLQAADGSFYVTTSSAIIYKMTTNGSILSQYLSAAIGTGLNPLIQGFDGSIYGTAKAGGTASGGTIYKIDLGGIITVLHNFGDGTVLNDGTAPKTLVQGSDSNFYGTTRTGGTAGKGVIFKVTPQGVVTILHHFGDNSVTHDGDNSTNVGFAVIGDPYAAALVQGTDGFLYGTTPGGGSAAEGTYFKVSTAGAVTILHSFVDGTVTNDGFLPFSSLIQGNDGNFYGTTAGGGATNNYGTVFQATPQGAITILHSFNSSEGIIPLTPVIQSSLGNFYGVTSQGGVNSGPGSPGQGTLYSIIPTQAPSHQPAYTGAAYATSSLYTPFSFTPTAFFGVSGSGAETSFVQPQASGGFMSALVSLLPARCPPGHLRHELVAQRNLADRAQLRFHLRHD